MFRLKTVKFLASHPSHLSKAAELLRETKSLQTFTLEQLHVPQQHLAVK